MTPADILHIATAAGVRIYADAGRIMASPRGAITDDLRGLIRAHKAALLKALAASVADVADVADLSGYGKEPGPEDARPRAALPEAPSDPATQTRKERALAMLAERPSIQYAVVVDDPDTDPVRLMLAIRGAMADGSIVTAELTVPKVKYDPALLLDLVARHSGTMH